MTVIFTGQTRGKWVARHRQYGWGEATQPHEYPPRREPWFLDCRAFYYWQRGLPFNHLGFYAAIIRLRADLEARTLASPAFIVAPDIVAAGLKSLAFSRSWLPHLRRTGCPLALVVQDGMEDADVEREIGPYSALFVGGSLPWKLATAHHWVRFAHERGRACHIGRCGTTARARWAIQIEADSLDSSLPNWSEDNLQRFLLGLDDRQAEFFPR